MRAEGQRLDSQSDRGAVLGVLEEAGGERRPAFETHELGEVAFGTPVRVVLGEPGRIRVVLVVVAHVVLLRGNGAARGSHNKRVERRVSSMRKERERGQAEKIRMVTPGICKRERSAERSHRLVAARSRFATQPTDQGMSPSSFSLLAAVCRLTGRRRRDCGQDA